LTSFQTSVFILKFDRDRIAGTTPCYILTNILISISIFLLLIIAINVADDGANDLIKELKNDVSELTSKKVRMLQLLEEKDRQFVELERHAILQEKKYLNELKV